ncbi:MAG: YgaP-like transmembrane domain [Pseudolysinimonas sp.]
MTSASACAASNAGWPLQRILFLLAGVVTLTGVVLGVLVSPWFLALSVLTGLNQLIFAAVGWCPMSLLLGRFGVRDLRELGQGAPLTGAR